MTENKKLKPLAEMVFVSEIVTQANFAKKAEDQLTGNGKLNSHREGK